GRDRRRILDFARVRRVFGFERRVDVFRREVGEVAAGVGRALELANAGFVDVGLVRGDVGGQRQFVGDRRDFAFGRDFQAGPDDDVFARLAFTAVGDRSPDQVGAFDPGG